jgi:protein TilB
LKKLDLTVNFVDIEFLEQSIYNLKANIMLEDLYLTGNPCEDWTGFKYYVIAHLPRLKQLDGKLILPHEKIQARQQLPQLTEDLERAVIASLTKKAAEKGIPVSEGAYTKESRVEMYMEMAEQKEEKERNERRRMGTEPKPKRESPGIYNARGEIRQCNEGKYDFNLDDQSEPGKVIFELGVPKYLETSSLDVDVNPLYVRCVIREKVTQLKLPAEVSPDASKVQRSKTTGALHIVMPVVDPRPVRQQAAQPQPELKPLQPEEDPKPRQKKLNGSVSVQGIYKDPRRVAKGKPKELLREVTTKRVVNGSLDDDDDDEIPALEPLRVR